MRLHIRAFLAILLILLPYRSDTASLPRGNPTKLVKLGDITSLWTPQESNSRAVAASSYQQQLDAHGASRSSRLAPVPASGFQVQAIRGPEWVEQFRRELERELYMQDAAQGYRHAQQPIPEPQEGTSRAVPQSTTAAQWYNLKAKHKLANVKVIRVRGANSLFTQLVRRKRGEIGLKPAKHELREWVLKRAQETSQTDRQAEPLSIRWKSPPDTLPRMEPRLQEILIATLTHGNQFRDHPERPFTNPYIVGGHLIYFQWKSDLNLFYVFAVPIDGKEPALVTRHNVVDFIGALEVKGDVSTESSESRASSS